MTEPVDLPINACHGKIAFTEFTLADRACKRGRQNHHATLTPYKCQHCHQWHIGERLAGRAKEHWAKRSKRSQGDRRYG